MGDLYDLDYDSVAGGFSRAFVGFILMPATVIKVRYEVGHVAFNLLGSTYPYSLPEQSL